MDKELMFNKAYGSLAGVMLGDALGMPVEGLPPELIKEHYGYIKDFVKAPEFHPGRKLELAQVTDDSLQTLIVAEAIIHSGIITLDGITQGLIKWAKNGALDQYYVGPSTRKALNLLIEGQNPETSGGFSNTCGAAMRVAPIGIINTGNPSQACKDAITCSLPTHGGNQAISAACAVASAISEAMTSSSTVESVVKAAFDGSVIGEKAGKVTASARVSSRIELAIQLVKGHKQPADAVVELSNLVGTTMAATESIPFSIGVFAITRGDPELAILTAVNAGGDTDSNASIAGAIAGAFKGFSALPKNKIKAIEDTNQINIKPIAHKLIEIASERLRV